MATSHSAGWIVLSTIALFTVGCAREDAPGATEIAVAPLNASPKVSDFVVEAQNSIRLQTGSSVTGGDVGALGTGSGPFLSGGVAIDVLTGAKTDTARNLIADSVKLGTGVTVGDVQTNRLVNGTGSKHGSVSGMVPLPPLLVASAVSPGASNLTVGTGATVTASSGQFATISVGVGAKLRLGAGTYDAADLDLSTAGRIEVLGPVQLHIANRLKASAGSFMGAASGTTLSARDLRIEVSGRNGTTGALGATPPAAWFGAGAKVTALVLVPNGSLVMGTGMVATGAFMGRDVDVGGSGAKLGFQDGFPACTSATCDDGDPSTLDRCATDGTCTHSAVFVTGSEGGLVSPPGEPVTLQVLPGALSDDVGITVEPTSGAVPSPIVPGAYFDLGPDGTVFAKPVRITIGYDPAKLSPGVPETALKLLTLSGGYWMRVPNSALDLANHTASGTIYHFSGVAVGCPPTDPLCPPCPPGSCGCTDAACFCPPEFCFPEPPPSPCTNQYWFDGDGDALGAPGSMVTDCQPPIGYVTNALDCNDSDPTVAGLTFYRDADGDGHGDPGQPITFGGGVCTPPVGFAVLSDDCDDADSLSFLPKTYYADADGDTYGDPDHGELSCGRPAGHVLTAGDCDDTNAGVNPSIPNALDVCDGRDNDCNGLVDDGPEALPRSITCGVGACQGAGTIACVAGALQSNCTPGSPAPSDASCNGVDDDCDGLTDEDFVPAAISCGLGECAAPGTTGCVGGTLVNLCVPALPRSFTDATCDGIDEDCDGTADEDFPLATTCGTGVCLAAGTAVCVDGAVHVSCTPHQPLAPTDTTCNGLDDDCDGSTDEDFVTIITCGLGSCAATASISCVAGTVHGSCMPGTPAATDPTCDGVDDDCDGQVDEDFTPRSSTCGVGACRASGSTSCVAGALLDSCTPGAPAATDATCDGIDDDCNGVADEDFPPVPSSCGLGPCAAAGYKTCVAGAVTDNCQPGTALGPDIDCDGFDSDCDGSTDEHFESSSITCGVGPCAAEGSTSCVAGAVHYNCTPGTPAATDASCDGIDDDCNGVADDGFPLTATTCGLGPCASTGIRSCVLGEVRDDCVPRPPAAPVDDSCNSIDDDCDGSTDEDFASGSTHCGLGRCAAEGSTSCVAGTVRDSCTPGTPEATDANCDGIDDDCNGVADDGFLEVITHCGVGVCQSTGIRSCVLGGVQDDCKPGAPTSPGDANCNGIDEDCSGTSDEGYGVKTIACGTGACMASGTAVCVSGVLQETCTPGQPLAPDDATCDGIDDDCDSALDEDFPMTTTTCGVGACLDTGYTVCTLGAVHDTCEPHTPAGSDTSCDAIDSDCDGSVDEDYLAPLTTCGVGGCFNTGRMVCTSGALHDTCTPRSPTANDATCDGIDDDCDGWVDEDCFDVGYVYLEPPAANLEVLQSASFRAYAIFRSAPTTRVDVTSLATWTAGASLAKTGQVGTVIATGVDAATSVTVRYGMLTAVAPVRAWAVGRLSGELTKLEILDENGALFNYTGNVTHGGCVAMQVRAEFNDQPADTEDVTATALYSPTSAGSLGRFLDGALYAATGWATNGYEYFTASLVPGGLQSSQSVLGVWGPTFSGNCADPRVPGSLWAVSTSPAGVSLMVGEARKLDATGFYADRSQRPVGDQVAWQTMSSEIVRMAPDGYATGLQVGTGSVRAVLSDLIGTSTVTVAAAPPLGALVGLSLEPAAGNIAAGSTFELKALASYSEWPGLLFNASGAASWSSTSPSTFNPVGGQGIAGPANATPAIVSAQLEGHSVSASVRVWTAARLIAMSRVYLEVANSHMGHMGCQQLKCLAEFNGDPADVEDVSLSAIWSLASPNWGTLTSSGFFLANGNYGGYAEISASPGRRLPGPAGAFIGIWTDPALPQSCGACPGGGNATWYRDTDADGYGAGGLFSACAQPDGYVAVSGDCNDGDAAVNPGATEILGNGKDDDCDGQVD